MAAATVASGYPVGPIVIGNKRLVIYKLTTPADTNTVATPIAAIDGAWAVDSSSSTVAADSVSATWSGSTVTLAVAGTARDVILFVIGF